ncbi:MAG: sulfite exporter TauE/SafE family protein [Pseudomonadales bacterium]|nr:sulfite exporter TauE/SafE family protein [Pseudomonadales bacterium]
MTSVEFILYILAGAVVGLAVGITGVGGGSLMTPMLLAFGFPLNVAVGTDLMYAAVTKGGGVIAYARQQAVRWDLVGLLATGGLPASAVSVAVLKYGFESPDQYTQLISTVLGFTLILTSLAIVFRHRLARLGGDWAAAGARKLWLMPAMGAVLGVLVTFSSVGAGAIGTAILMMFYPRLKALRVVGTDIAHAVPLTLFAGMGHLFLGNVDFLLLGALLLGSLPAVSLGARLGKLIPDTAMRPVLATILFGVGVKVGFF